MYSYLPFFSSIAPALVLLYIFYSQDKYPEPPQMILKTFCFGIAICILAGYLNGFATTWIFSLWNDGTINHTMRIFLDSLIPGAVVEEFLKYLVLYFFCFRSEHLDERIDALVYGTTVSLGFAALENYNYVMNAEYFDLTWEYVAWLRAFSAVPAHAMFGIIMGYFLYNYQEHKLKSFSLALGVPIILHTLYNASYFPYIIVLIVALFLSIVFISKSKKIQRMNPWTDYINDNEMDEFR